MKKICLFILILFLVPFTAIAEMRQMSDTQMEAVTGQAGVTLAPIDFSLDLNVKNLAYTDPPVEPAPVFSDIAIQGIGLILYAYPRMVKSADGTIGPIPSGSNVYKEYIASSLAARLAKLSGRLTLGNALNLRHRPRLRIGARNPILFDRSQLVISPY